MFTTLNVSVDLILVTMTVGFFVGLSYTAGAWLATRILSRV